MRTAARPALGLILAVLFALTPAVQPQADVRTAGYGCLGAGCDPFQQHRVTQDGLPAGLIAAATRIDVEAAGPRVGGLSTLRGGVDLLFRARNELLLARARVSIEEHRSTSPSLLAAIQDEASSPSRAPPNRS